VDGYRDGSGAIRDGVEAFAVAGFHGVGETGFAEGELGEFFERRIIARQLHGAAHGRLRLGECLGSVALGARRGRGFYCGSWDGETRKGESEERA
jgi:hypothetical protein